MKLVSTTTQKLRQSFYDPFQYEGANATSVAFASIECMRWSLRSRCTWS